jgi:hypothetical protein
MAFGDLTTLSDVTAWLNTGTGSAGSFPATDDALLSRLITAASGFIIQWLQRPIVSAQYQEVRDGITGYGLTAPCEARFGMAATPITAVASVVVGSLLIPQAPTITPGPPGMNVASPWQPGWAFTPTQIVIRGYPVPRMTGIVQITYTGGFAAVPFDVAQACIELVAFKYKGLRARAGGERSRRIDTEVVSYAPRALAYSARDMTTDIQSLLQQYRRVAPLTAFIPEPLVTESELITVTDITPSVAPGNVFTVNAGAGPLPTTGNQINWRGAALSGGRTTYLPPASACPGQEITIKDAWPFLAGSQPISLVPLVGTIDGQSGEAAAIVSSSGFLALRADAGLNDWTIVAQG